jgi:tetratricopeptide (TPR) repeat protein
MKIKHYFRLFTAISLSQIIPLSSLAQPLQRRFQVDIQPLLNEARKEREVGEFDSAINLMTQGIQQQPSNNILYYERGLNYFYLTEYEKALADFNQSINLHVDLPLEFKPDTNEVYYYRGISKYEWALSRNLSRENFDEEIKKSVEDIQLSIQANPDKLLSLLREGSRQPTDLQTFDAGYKLAMGACSSSRRNSGKLSKLIGQLNKPRSGQYKIEIDTRIKKATIYIKKHCP